MAEVVYYDSNYAYIDPIRHFKANDPYYYEVDNIPIKQLEESKNFLKDQVDGILKDRANFSVQVNRSNITELKPFTTGSDRKVRVMPGRYTARINDAYTATPLQFISQVAGFSNTFDANGNLAPMNTWSTETNIGANVSAVLNQFQNGLTGDALNMNGLAERAFTFPIPDEDGTPNPSFDLLNVSAPGYASFGNLIGGIPASDFMPLYPNFIGQVYANATTRLQREMQLIRNVYTGTAEPTGVQANKLESEFIKRWRGAIRTSVVDVSGEMVITVPDFDESDFFYLDENGSRQSLQATQRIDLLFIYSKAVDQTDTTIPSFMGGTTPKRILKPTLGILKGAGLGISRQTAGPTGGNELDVTPLQDADGTPLMLAHPGDEAGANTGFSTSAGIIKGSFPSPDDLLNLAPVLSENLESGAFPLIGQSILPIAYIRVTNTGQIASILTDSDIIDIRPFLRTAELSYNERAGIAAATPQLSIANPVVTESHLEKVRREVFGTLNDKIDNLNIPNIPTDGRVVGTGMVCGGVQYGPEGALIRQAAPNITNSNLLQAQWNQIADAAEDFFSYPPGKITFNPEWDLAPWSRFRTPAAGTFGASQGLATDFIHVCWPLVAESQNSNQYYLPPWKRSVYFGGTGARSTLNGVISEYGSDYPSMNSFGVKPACTLNLLGDVTSETLEAEARRNNVVIFYCRKVIRLDRDSVPWMKDYSVNVKLVNCIPLSCKQQMTRDGGGSGRHGQGQSAGASNIWVNKMKNYFVINVAWVANDFNRELAEQNFNGIGKGLPWARRRNGDELAGFAVPEIPIPEPGDFQVYGPRSRNKPGETPLADGDAFLAQVNAGVNNTTGVSNEETFINDFTPVTPVIYPTVQFDVVGYSEATINRNNQSMLPGTGTPTLILS